MVANLEGPNTNETMENGVEEDEPNFSDPEDFIDEITDEDLVGDVLGERPLDTELAQCCIIVDGIPKVGGDRLPRLQNVLQKIFKRFGDNFKDHYPKDENGDTKGYCFVEYASKSNASDASEVLSGHRLDRNHTFTVNLFSDLDKFTEPDSNWKPPEPRPYKDHGNLWWWLELPGCQDQFVVQDDQGERISVFWNVPGEPILVNDKARKQRWSETIVQWSPRGTYLATFHAQGIALWGGEDFAQISRFAHPKVLMIDFSPCETYLVTYSKAEGSRWSEIPDALRLWDVRTGEVKRSFPLGGGVSLQSWPHFKWTHDDKYFACGREGVLSVYSTPSMGLLDKKSIKVEGLKDFCWSPKDNTLAYWVAEQGQTPARVVVMRLPDKVELRTKNLFNVADATLFWQTSGDHLGVKIERYGKRKELEPGNVTYSSVTHHLEVFRLRERDVPVDSLELKEPILAFGWEPTGHKFCVLLGSHLKATPAFYSVETGITHIKSLDAIQGLSHVLWAPAGGWLVLAGLKGSTASVSCTGNLVFIDTNGEIQKIQQAEHAGCQDVCWDPTGRYVASVYGLWYGGSRTTDTSYRIWTFQGQELTRKPAESLCQLIWRPRPPTLLADADKKDIKRKMKQYAHDFEEQDKREKVTASKEVVEKRQALKAEFDKWHKERKKEYSNEKTRRIELRGYDTEVPITDQEEETLEIPETTKETIEKSAPTSARE